MAHSGKCRIFDNTLTNNEHSFTAKDNQTRHKKGNNKHHIGRIEYALISFRQRAYY